jgi:hypothetical protein
MWEKSTVADSKRYVLVIFATIFSIVLDVFFVRGYAAIGVLFFYCVSYFSNNKSEKNRWQILCVGLLGIFVATVFGLLMSVIIKNEWSKVNSSCLVNLEAKKKIFLESNKNCISFFARSSAMFYDSKQKILVYSVFPYKRIYLGIPSMESKEVFD